MEDKGQQKSIQVSNKNRPVNDFVLEKDIFSNIFERDIRRVYIYKKTERLARAVHLIAPAFVQSPAFKKRADEIAIALIDAAALPPLAAKETLGRELLSLSSILSIARTGGLLSPMNADLIARESEALLEEIATYEAPRLILPATPSMAELSKESHRTQSPAPQALERRPGTSSKGHVSDKHVLNTRREEILNVLKMKGPSFIKDISIVVRGVSEKTIQRELQALVASGKVRKEGDRRWTRYSLPA